MTPTRRTALMGSAGLLAGLATGFTAATGAASANPSQMEADPIFAAIERTRAAWCRLCAACNAADHAQETYGADSIEYELADACNGELSAGYGDFVDAFLATVPTTMPGVLAYLDFINDVAAFRDIAIEPWQQEIMLASLKGALLRYVELPGSPAPVGETVPVTRELLENYDAWLVYEHERLNGELGNRGSIRVNVPGADYHMPHPDRPASPSPSTRAARVLSAVGCPLKGEV